MRKNYLVGILIVFLLFNLSAWAENIKEPTAAGAFYPANPNQLSQQINDFLDKAEPKEIKGEIFGLISPHAGYVYSGGVAAYGYKLLRGKQFDTVIIIGPTHFVNFTGVSVWAKGSFKTPLGVVPIDEELAQEIINQNPNVIKFYSAAFEKEHSVEAQIPFLQEALKDFKIVPIVMSKPDINDARILADAINKVCKNKKVLVVASSDMSHYHNYKEAVSMDRLALKYLSNLDAQGLYNSCAKGETELCGLGPVSTLLIFAKENNLRLEVLKYANSGDVTFDLNRVVGYTSCVVYKENGNEAETSFNKNEETEMLNEAQKKRLLEIARRSLENYVTFGKRENFSETDAALTRECGAFVTLTKNGQLRGCIGHIVGDTALYKTIADMAIEAGTGDPRFPKVTATELKDIEIEISVLTEPRLIPDWRKIRLGIDGVIIARGVFLPQVATETGWDLETFLSQLCWQKAGLPPDYYKDSNAKIYTFQALVFSEKEVQ